MQPKVVYLELKNGKKIFVNEFFESIKEKIDSGNEVIFTQEIGNKKQIKIERKYVDHIGQELKKWGAKKPHFFN